MQKILKIGSYHSSTLFKMSGKLSNKIFDTLWDLLKETFPKAMTNLTSSYYSADKLINQLGFKHKKYDACTNDCTLYQGCDKERIYVKHAKEFFDVKDAKEFFVNHAKSLGRLSRKMIQLVRKENFLVKYCGIVPLKLDHRDCVCPLKLHLT